MNEEKVKEMAKPNKAGRAREFLQQGRKDEAYGDNEYYRKGFLDGGLYADEHPKCPWRNVVIEEPKKDQDVFAHKQDLCGGEYCKLTYLGNYRWSQDEGEWTTEFYNNEVLWMPIPELKGGE